MMGKICVTRNAEFFNTANRLGIPANNLEVIVHNYMNNVKPEFPSDDYIKSKFYLKPFITTSWNVIDGWRKYYSSPIVLSKEDRVKVIADAISFFGNLNVLVYDNPKGERVLVVATPFFKKANINDKVPEGLVSTDIYDRKSYEYDLSTYNKHAKQYNTLTEADKAYKDLLQQYPGRVRLARDKHNPGKWIVDVLPPHTTDDKFKIYIPLDSEDRYEEYYSSLSLDEILSQLALAELERKEYKDEDIDNMLLQKKNLLLELDKLKTINRPLSSTGSIKKIKEALKRTGVSPLIYNTIIKAIELDPSLTALNPYDLFQVISKQQSTDLADLYNKYLQEPINKALEEHLIKFLERYHVDINIGNAIQKFGVAGAYDIINKVIYLANEQDRNSITFAEEFAHAFVELMGAKVSGKPENADFTFLYKNVENTKIYRQVYEEYKDTYVKDGKPDLYKIRKEAIGQALAVAIKNKWENRDIRKEQESGFWAKLKEWFNNILNAFTGAEYLNFDSLIDTIAEEVIMNDHSRLQKVDASSYSLLNYSETIVNQNKKDGGKALEFMQFYCNEMGNIITGSLSYRMQGTVYRSSLDALHDIDMIVPPGAHNIPLDSSMFRTLSRGNKFGTTVLLDYLKDTEYFKKVQSKYPKLVLSAAYDKGNYIVVNAVYSENESLSERFNNMSGSYASRLDRFTEEERGQIYLFDFFLHQDETPYITDTDNELKLSLYSESFREKLVMGRAKDIYDYQTYKLFEEFKGLHAPTNEGIMFQKPKSGFIWNAEQNAAIRDVSDFINRRLRGEEPQPFYTIQGKAGTGKTTIINAILDNVLIGGRYTTPVIGIGALSHKAKEVLTGKISKSNKSKFNIKSKSIAGLLGIKPLIIFDENTKEAIEVFQIDELDFTRKSVFHEASVVFIDEASMVNENILEIIKKDIGDRKVAVVFIGDIGQLPPIRSDKDPYYKGKNIPADKPSPVFDDHSIPKSMLAVRVRQGEDSPVLTYADKFWNFSNEVSNKYPIDKVTGAETVITDLGAIVILDRTIDLTLQLLPLFEKAKRDKNPNVVKIVAYKNTRVDEYNRKLHFSLHPEAAENNDMNFLEGDLIIFNDNFQISTFETIENASEGIVTKILDNNEYIHNDNTSPIKIRTIQVKLQDGKEWIVPIIENSDENVNIHKANLESLKRYAMRLQKGTYEQKLAWIQYYDYKNKFANIGYGYAITTHRSQGSTYEVVAVDSANIEGVKPISYKSKSRAIYTALTRASNVTVVSSSTSLAPAPDEEIFDINERIKEAKKNQRPIVTEQLKLTSTKVREENNTPPVSNRPADIEGGRRIASIQMNGQQLNLEYVYYDKENPDRLANSKSDGTLELFKLRGNSALDKINYFFDYILGRDNKKYSGQKTQIFKELARLGYTEEYLRKIFTTPKDVYTFLLLHENQHVLNKDHETAAAARDFDKETLDRIIYKLEYRATYNALVQLIASKNLENPEDKLRKDNAFKILEDIRKFNEEHITFDENTHTYFLDGIPVDTSVTSVLHGLIEEDSQFLKVSSAVGTTHDTIARDYLGSPKVVKYDYPNMTEEDVKSYHKELDRLRKSLDTRFGSGRYTIVTDESMLRLVGRININGQFKTIAGTMDMLVIDGEGNFHIYDFKTNRANSHTEFTAENQIIYPKQVEMYKLMLMLNYPAKVASTNIVLFNILYDTPKGTGKYETGDISYEVVNGQIIASHKGVTQPIQSMVVAGAFNTHRVYTPGTLHKVHDNVQATLTEGEKILPYKEEVPNNLKDSLDKAVSEKRVVTAEDKKRAIELLTNSIDFAKGVIDKIDYSAKYKPMSEESKATRAEMVSRLEELTKLLEGLKDGSSEVIVNLYGVPLVVSKDVADKLDYNIILSTTGYKKGDPQKNPDTAYVFTENVQASMAIYDFSEEQAALYKKHGNILGTVKVNVSDVNGTNQAGIRTDARGNYSRNAFGIIVKKRQQDESGRWLAKEGQFEDTDADFEMFKDYNKRFFKELDNSGLKKIVFPTLMALGKAALPLRFAKWLLKELLDRYGIISEVLENNNTGYEGYGLSIKAVTKIIRQENTELEIIEDKYSDVDYAQVIELLIKNPREITIDMLKSIASRYKNGELPLDESEKTTLNNIYNTLLKGDIPTKSTIVNTSVYKVERINNTNDLYTGAVKITLDVNAPKYGRKEALSRILNNLDISNIVYLDGVIGPDFFATISWMRLAGLNEVNQYRREYIGNHQSLIDSARLYGLVYNEDTGEVFIPAFVVGLTESELRTIRLNDIILNSDLFTPSELRNLSKAAIYKLSEYITMLTTLEEANEILLGDDFKDFNFVGKDRIEVIEVVGLTRLLNIVKERFFNTEDERTYDWDFDTIDKADIIYNNFEAFIDLGYDALIGMEGVSKYSLKDVVTDLLDALDDKTAQEIQEIFGNSIEHWLVGFRLVNAFSSLSQMIKRTFEKMYILDENGNLVINKFGFAETISPLEAVAKILKWTQYSESVKDMIDKISIHKSTNPWISQIIDKLESNDEDFKSQFFSNFKKYFQKYSIVYKDTNGKVLMKMINESSYSDVIMDELKGKVSSYAMGNYKLKNTDGTVNITALNLLKEVHKKLLDEVDELGKEDKKVTISSIRLLEEAYRILDIPTPEFLEFINSISKGTLMTAVSKLGFLIDNFNKNLDNVEFNPLKGGEYKYLIGVSANILGESLEAVSYEAGKLYYSYVTPSYLNKLIGKLQGHTSDFNSFIQEEYGKYRQFKKNPNSNRYRPYWLDLIVNDENIRKHLDHKASLHFDGVNYVDKTPALYIASLIQEFRYDDNKAWAWYRIPMMSNKPSEEYIKFVRINKGYKEAITGHLLEIMAYEIDRMSAVYERKTLSKDDKIENFDTKGEKFVFLDYLNQEIDDNTELGSLIIRKVQQSNPRNVPLNPTEETRFLELAQAAIRKGMEAKFQEEKVFWKNLGFLTETADGLAVKEIDLGRNSQEIEEALSEYFWNDTFAAINILMLTVTDVAYYKHAEDLQKRLALLHAPGMRANLDAKDFNGIPYTDGKFRTVILEDFKVESEIIPNLEVLREELIAKETDKVKIALIRSLFNDILKAFKDVNVTDAQAYSSPTSYRKKMGIFGKWSLELEDIYNKIKAGDVTPENLAVLWQPLKPFVYTQTERPGHSSVFPTIKVGYQFKNSEYLLIIADALLRAGNKPNRLSAIYDIMEESADNNPSRGIDTFQFKSAVKTGLSNVIDINSFDSVEDIKKELRNKLYTADGYSSYVITAPMEDFSLQLEVPGHFKGQLLAGSQNRILTVADFPNTDAKGNDILIEVDGEKITVKEAKRRYFKAIADNIDLSFLELVKRFKLDNLNPKMLNIAISRVLLDAILKDSRMGSDLLWACSVNKFGEFNIPLSDPTQSDRIQLLLNSIIKNNINKLEIAGGPVVLVSNYGTADELHIRYQNENGEVLMTEEEYNMEESPTGFIPKDGTNSFAEYLKKHQKSVAYFECYVPIYDDNLVKDFGKPDGTIDIEAMERTNPDLLKMIGYRIPTEAKYSMVPIKIKGFLPPNAGEGIMLPKEITTMSGSDKISLFEPL